MYDVETRAVAGACVEMPRQTLTEKLQQERANLANRMTEIDAVIADLTANPQVQTILDLLQKTRGL